MMKKRLNKSNIVIIGLLLILFAVIIKSAWIVDDAYISFRYIKNLFDGYGLRWNTFERVQGYTNPLYVFCLIPFYLVSKDMFLSSIFLSVALSMAAVIIGIYPKNKRSLIPFILCILALMTSKAFIDYATSGLENSMTFLITALFYRTYFSMEKPYDNKSFLKLCLIASLVTINRIDAIILFIPPLCYGFFKNFSSKKIGMGLLGFMPFIVWEIFSFFYYGFLFPNTAYAKLNIATGKIDQIVNGIKYIFSSNIYGDNITLIAIVIVVILGIYLIKRKKTKHMTAIIAMISYVLYSVYIGGDFMVGRFMSGPFFLSILILYDYMSGIDLSDLRNKKLAEKSAVFIGVIILFLGCVPQTSTITSPVRYQNYRDYLRDTNPIDRPRDVRSYYYDETGLTYYLMDIARNGYNPDRVIHKWGREGQMLESGEVYVAGGIGFMGYFCPDETVIIDQYALVDPLLARIPAPPNQWAAHNQRGVPIGYELTLKTGENAIENEALHEYYDKLNLVVSGPIFNAERLKTAVNFNLGKYDYLMDEYILSSEYRETLAVYGR